MTPRFPAIRFMTDAARREQETMKKKATPKLSLSITGGVSRNSTATPPRHASGNLTPPVTPPITPSSSFRSSTPTGTTEVRRVLKTEKDESQIVVKLMEGLKPTEANEPFRRHQRTLTFIVAPSEAHSSNSDSEPKRN